MRKPKDSTLFLLKAFMPYTESNLLLTYKPNKFFNELERMERKEFYKHFSSTKSAKQSYYRLRKNGYIIRNGDGSVSLSEKAKSTLALYCPQKLQGARLLVIFDIPERDRAKRRELRLLLRALRFKQVQRSVWESSYDGRKILKQEISRLGIHDFVRIYEAEELIV